MNIMQIDALKRVQEFLKAATASVGDTMHDEEKRLPFHPRGDIENDVIRFDIDNLRFATSGIDSAIRNIDHVIKRHKEYKK